MIGSAVIAIEGLHQNLIYSHCFIVLENTHTHTHKLICFQPFSPVKNSSIAPLKKSHWDVLGGPVES